MFNIRRCYSFTRSFYSLHQLTTFNDPSPFRLAKKCHSFRVCSSSATTKQETNAQTDSEEEDRKLKFIQLEISLLRECGGKAPNVDLLKKHHWDELLTMNSQTARHRYYKFLFVTEKAKENKKVSDSIHL